MPALFDCRTWWIVIFMSNGERDDKVFRRAN